MEYRTVHDVSEVARVYPSSTRASRRARLERFATLLERHQGPFRLLSRIEYIPVAQRQSLRRDDSPLTIAYENGVFRAEGLASDRLGEAERFCDLTQAHHLLCDCHDGMGAVTPDMVAHRARAMARSPRLGELWHSVRSRVASLLQRRAPLAHQALVVAGLEPMMAPPRPPLSTPPLSVVARSPDPQRSGGTRERSQIP